MFGRGVQKERNIGNFPISIWVVVKIMVPFWVPEIIGAVLH